MYTYGLAVLDRIVKKRWLLCLAGFACAFFLVLLPKIADGTLWHNDEILSANRVREMLVRHDPFVITRNFNIDCKKPPLQYWLTALVYKYGTRFPELSIRVVSTLYGALDIVLTGILGWIILPSRKGKYLGLAAAVGVLMCGYFVHMARLGLLDCGAAFHLTAVLLGCQLVVYKKDERWWWFVGLQAVLGAWQKVPYGIFAWIIILSWRAWSYWREGNLKEIFSWHLMGAFVSAILLIGLWPMLLWWRFGAQPLNLAYHAQSFRLSSRNYPALQHFHAFVYWFWLTRDWALIGFLAPIAAGGIVWKEWKSFRQMGKVANPGLFECAFVMCVGMIGLALMPFRVQRYLVSLTPVFSILVFYWVWNYQKLLSGFRAKCALTIALLLCSAPVAILHYTRRAPAQSELLTVVQGMQSHLRGNENIVIAPLEEPTFNILQFTLFYAQLERAIYPLSHEEFFQYLQELGDQALVRSWIGIARAEFVNELAQKTGSPVEIVSQSGPWVCWKMSR